MRSGQMYKSHELLQTYMYLLNRPTIISIHTHTHSQKMTGFNPEQLPDLTGKVVIVTGGNVGMHVSSFHPSHFPNELTASPPTVAK